MKDSKTQWTDHTFNPWRGCTKVSPGCANCYAETMSKRNKMTLGVWGANGTRVVASETMWREPVKWDRAAAAAGERHRVFCASLADVFEGRDTMPKSSWAEVASARGRLFDLIQRTPHLDWLLLTKRPENVSRFEPAPGWIGKQPNVWIGTSVENQETADERIKHLFNVPAAVRFLSVEPLLGPVDLREIGLQKDCPKYDSLKGVLALTGQRGPRIDWVIVGGESGPNARPCHVDWIRLIVRQCKAAGVPVFVKQLGAVAFTDHTCTCGRNADRSWKGPAACFSCLGQLRLNDPKGGNPDEWPEDLRVRELPKGAA